MKMDHKEIDWEGMDWIYVAPNRDMWCVLVNMIRKLQVAWNVVSALNSWGSCSISRMTLLYGSSYIMLHCINFGGKKTSLNQDMRVFQLLNISWQNVHVVVGQRLILCDMDYCITVLLEVCTEEFSFWWKLGFISNVYYMCTDYKDWVILLCKVLIFFIKIMQRNCYTSFCIAFICLFIDWVASHCVFHCKHTCHLYCLFPCIPLCMSSLFCFGVLDLMASIDSWEQIHIFLNPFRKCVGTHLAICQLRQEI
jgi:hypothetical protein